ncbi:hypothetical protein HDE69_001798 [Pedobacter cryoconitis]|uniref:Uncharacterized protein n=1 Tax=Pedobacter cryoconitis TaxID=188932 RepID=A0A7W8YSL9_9SPHI|nr:hypothetical protein [Pedobacter cryoconitis]MBB5646061.1 hypothetical protein [Pedobacter cryoconitis]
MLLTIGNEPVAKDAFNIKKNRKSLNTHNTKLV